MSQAKARITPAMQTTTYEFQMRGPPPKKTLAETVYDSETGKILGRSPKNWGQLLLFYSIFYTVLASLFTLCLQGLFLSMDDHEPTWTLEESLIGANPGLAYRPHPDDNNEFHIMSYNPKNQSSVGFWTDNIDHFLETYANKSLLPGGGINQVHCDFDQRPAEGQVCSIAVDNFGGCKPKSGYGYNQSAPCIFVKLNKIYNWVPQYYNDPSDLPEDMPESLKTYITSLDETKRNQVWVSCDGQSQPDKNVLKGKILYPAGQGMPEYYYPYRNQMAYLSPIVPVKLERPEPGQTFTLECKAWAKNIVYRSGRERTGSFIVEIRISA